MKIVAIGGGNNSNIKKNGLPEIYEHEAIDKEIISLTDKEYPHILFISHASDRKDQTLSYRKILNTYEKNFTHSGLMPGYCQSIDWRTKNGVPCGYNYLADNYYFLLSVYVGKFKMKHPATKPLKNY